MMLEAVWFKNGEEVFKVSPVMNIVCYNSMYNISEIEVEDEHKWYEYEDIGGEADDFVIRLKKD